MVFVKSLLRNRVLHHVLFWVGMFLLNVYSQFLPSFLPNVGGSNTIYGLNIYEHGWEQVLIRTIPLFLCLVAFSTIHTEVLFPKFFKKGLKIKYAVLVVACFMIFPKIQLFLAQKLISPKYDFTQEIRGSVSSFSTHLIDTTLYLKEIDENFINLIKEETDLEKRAILVEEKIGHLSILMKPKIDSFFTKRMKESKTEKEIQEYQKEHNGWKEFYATKQSYRLPGFNAATNYIRLNNLPAGLDGFVLYWNFILIFLFTLLIKLLYQKLNQPEEKDDFSNFEKINTTQNRILYHVLFWTGLLLINMYVPYIPFPYFEFYGFEESVIYGLNAHKLGFSPVLFSILPSFLCLVAFCTLHTAFLMPLFLKRKRYLLYLFGVVFSFLLFPQAELFFAKKFISPKYDLREETEFQFILPFKSGAVRLHRVPQTIWDEIKNQKDPIKRQEMFDEKQMQIYSIIATSKDSTLLSSMDAPEEVKRKLKKLLKERSRSQSRFFVDKTNPSRIENFNDLPISLDRNELIYFRFGFLFLLTSIIKLSRDWFRHSKQIETKSERKTTELALLQNQINPHFLFNTLNNLQSLARLKSEKTEPTILKLSELMRYMLKEGKNGKVLLSKEIKFIESYIELEQLRLGNRAKIVFRKEINPHTTEVPPLIFISFIENAFKHGVNSLTEGAYITILLTEPMEEKHRGKAIHFQIVNNYDDTTTTSGTGQGLENVKRRLELLYPNGKHHLKIEQVMNTFNVSLKIFLV